VPRLCTKSQSRATYHQFSAPQQIHPRQMSTGSYQESQPRRPVGSLDNADHDHFRLWVLKGSPATTVTRQGPPSNHLTNSSPPTGGEGATSVTNDKILDEPNRSLSSWESPLQSSPCQRLALTIIAPLRPALGKHHLSSCIVHYGAAERKVTNADTN
jgi:hypothetical protein